MSAADTGMPAQTAQPKLSEIERITKVFYEPSATFTDIKRSAWWLAPWLVMALFSWGYSAVVASKIGWQTVAENQRRLQPAAQQERLAQMPPDQRARAEQMGLTITKTIGYGFPVFSLAWLAIVALVLWGTFNFGTGAQAKYGRSLAVLVYASLPGIIKALVMIAVVMAGVDKDTFMVQNPVGTNIGYYLGINDTPRWLYSLGSAIDIFMIWTLVLTAIGFSIITGKSKGTSYGVVFGWWALVTMVSVGMAAAFS